MRTRSTTIVSSVVLLLLIWSILACNPPTGLRRTQAPTPPPPLSQQDDDAPQDDNDDDPQARPDAPLVDAQRTKEEDSCDDGDNIQCQRFARKALAQAGTDPDLKARAAMAMYQACTNADGDACYIYGLMVWLRSGAPYDPAEISWSFQQARALGSMHARMDYKELIEPSTMAEVPNTATRYHYKQGCDWGIQIACSAHKAHMNSPAMPQGSRATPPRSKPADALVVRAQPALATEVPATQPPVTPQPKAQAAAPRETRAQMEQRLEREMMAQTLPMFKEVSLGVVGGVDAEVVRSGLKTRNTQLLYCYEKSQMDSPELRGRMNLMFTINANGSVIAADFKGTTLPRDTVKCMSKLVKLWRFAAPDVAQLTQATYVVDFAPDINQ